jgi:hypothetical protein
MEEAHQTLPRLPMRMRGGKRGSMIEQLREDPWTASTPE